jgi:hypothetical protein
MVGGSDFLDLCRSFGAGRRAPGRTYDEDVDWNADGTIGGPEFLFFGRSFGRAPGPSARCPADDSRRDLGCPAR